jgi:hypothetical protein
MESIMIGLGILLAIAIPIGVGQLAAGWLVARLWPSESELLLGWVLGVLAAVIITLLIIAGWAIYQDKLWHGLMHPLAFIGSVALVILALLSLPSLWGQLRLLAEGETAVGTIETLTTSIDYDSQTNITNTIYSLTYRFATATGDQHNNRVRVTQALYQRFSEGDEINIAYLPDRPGYSLPEVGIEPESRARRIFTFLLAVYIVLGETVIITFFGKRTLNRFNY